MSWKATILTRKTPQPPQGNILLIRSEFSITDEGVPGNGCPISLKKENLQWWGKPFHWLTVLNSKASTHAQQNVIILNNINNFHENIAGKVGQACVSPQRDATYTARILWGFFFFLQGQRLRQPNLTPKRVTKNNHQDNSLPITQDFFL